MNNKNSRLIYQMCLIAVFTALDFVITYFVAIPIKLSGIGSGYFNFSDVIIFVVSALIGPWAGGFVGGVSGCLSDLSLGYGIFAPYTLVIKFAEGVVAGFIFKGLKKIGKESKIQNIWKSGVAFIIGGLVMALLYMIPDYVTYVQTAIADPNGANYLPVFIDLAFNTIQGILNAFIGCAVFVSIYQVQFYLVRRMGNKNISSSVPKCKKDDVTSPNKERK